LLFFKIRKLRMNITKVMEQTAFTFRMAPESKERMDVVTKVFQENIVPLYGDQTAALTKIQEAKDRHCELLFEGETPVGVLVYKKDPNDECVKFEGREQSLEIKTLFVIQSQENSGRGLGSQLLQRVVQKAENVRAKAIHVTVSENKPESLAFFQKKSFSVIQTVEGLYQEGVKEFVLQRYLA